MNFAKYRVQLCTEKKYSSKYEYEYSIPDNKSLKLNNFNNFAPIFKIQTDTCF